MQVQIFVCKYLFSEARLAIISITFDYVVLDGRNTE